MKIFLLWLFAFCSAPFLAFGQGSLTPPPGAPGPTMKTLDQVEARTPLSQPVAPATLPIVISSSGSYYLTGNVTAPAGYTGSGISVSSNVSNVTIDLNGFTLTGVSGSGRGVLLSGGVSNVTILNGTIRNWSSEGINGVGNRNVRVENIQAIGNGGGGIKVDVNGVVSRCLADGNTGIGILGTTGCLISHCQTSGTSGSPGRGIQVGTASVITDSISNGDVIGMQMANDAQLSNCRVMNSSGVSGFAFGNGCTFDGCAVAGGSGGGFNGFNNTSGLNSSNCVFRGCSSDTGFKAGAGSTFQNCSGSYFYALKGLAADGGSGTNASFSNCTATVDGFQTGSGCTFSNCSSNGSTGFQTLDGSTLIGCTASGDGVNGGFGGFNVGNGCLVSSCTATGFAGDGFVFIGGCLLIGNTARNNTQDGFNGSGVNNRIEGNLAQSNGSIGIHSASATADQILRNTSIGNAIQYNPSSGNNVGPTTGNPATSTSPWANF